MSDVPSYNSQLISSLAQAGPQGGGQNKGLMGIALGPDANVGQGVSLTNCGLDKPIPSLLTSIGGQRNPMNAVQRAMLAMADSYHQACKQGAEEVAGNMRQAGVMYDGPTPQGSVHHGLGGTGRGGDIELS